MSAEYARRANVDVTLAGADISQDIAPFLISVTYDDNRSGEADSIAVELEDRDGRFRGDWFPKKNSTLNVVIRVSDWDKHGDNAALQCGIFELDEIETSQGRFNMKGISVPVTAGGRREKITKTWEKIKLKQLAGDIATKAALTLNYTAIEDPYYGRIDQKQESSLEFITRIVHKAGLSIKIINNKMAIYNEVDAEKEDAALTIERTKTRVLDWNFKTQSVETYQSCEVSYFDPKTKKTIVGTATATGNAPSGQVLKINERVENQAAAIALAEKKLRDANKREVTGSLTLMGDTRILDGVVIAVKDFGTFDGKYRIAKSTHTVSADGGYTTSCDLESGPPTVRDGGKGEKRADKKANKKKRKNEPEWKAIVERNRTNG
ncbi:hypothetical protein EOM60_05150 [Candidatus Saccharibacteria bacterium]|nr:hypothetical protein [Candidatus Saccharibacteria bacterium]